ncbi:hypothetical protein SAMN04488092_1067 [Thalassovita taeanensis]|uniref:Uncharacterized protein n=2 Tax=Thalassovita taeanensis TaxID=657014 RepID=A0A1H9FA65_9RHOB|nr:hypothetical protein SAMN04488092_1067 [Thalassovita taeanensis]
MRDGLDKFCSLEINVEELAATYPSCACEQAEPLAGSPGRVMPKEVLRLFLTSPSHLKVKKPADLIKRKFKAADLVRAYRVGLSVVRLDHALEDELIYTARKLHEIQVNANGDKGGLVGAVDFPVEAVRACSASHVPMCVHETPLDRTDTSGYLRPSHGDVVNSMSGMSDEEQKASREVIYNQIIKQGAVKDIEDVNDFDMSIFIPRAAM